MLCLAIFLHLSILIHTLYYQCINLLSIQGFAEGSFSMMSRAAESRSFSCFSCSPLQEQELQEKKGARRHLLRATETSLRQLGCSFRLVLCLRTRPGLAAGFGATDGRTATEMGILGAGERRVRFLIVLYKVDEFVLKKNTTMFLQFKKRGKHQVLKEINMVASLVADLPC